MTQNDDVLALLERAGDAGITSIDALRELGVFRLAARILELKQDGHDIDSSIVTVGNGKRVARYRLVPPSEPRQEAIW